MEYQENRETLETTKETIKGHTKEDAKENSFGVECKFSLIDNGQFLFGPGSKALFELIEKTGSVKSACEEMGMSYSKAWKKIREAQEALGCEVVTRVQGGKGGGQASLTPQGKWLCETYTSFTEEATRLTKALFGKYFDGNLLEGKDEKAVNTEKAVNNETFDSCGKAGTNEKAESNE